MHFNLSKWRIKSGGASLYSVFGEILLLILSLLSILFIPLSYSLIAVYFTIRGGNMQNIDPSMFLISAIVIFVVGTIFFIITLVLYIIKAFTKDPIRESIEKIQSDIKDMKKDIQSLTLALNNFISTFQGISQAKRQSRSKRNRRSKK